MKEFRELTEAKVSAKKVDKLFSNLVAELRELGLSSDDKEFVYYLRDSIGYQVQQARNDFDALKSKYKVK